MKTIVVTMAAIAVLMSPAYAQMDAGPHKDPLQLMYEKQKKDQEDAEREYNATMKRTKSQGPAPKSDPWAGVRPAENTGSKR